MAAGRRPTGPLVRVLRLCLPRPDLPAAAGAALPGRGLDAGAARAAVRPRRTPMDRSRQARPTSVESPSRTPRRAYADGVRPGPGAPARGQLLRGQPHLPGRASAPTSTRRRRTSGCARSTPRRTPASCSTISRTPRVAAELVARAVRPGHRRPGARDQADQGHDARAAATPDEDERLRAGAGQRPEVPRREPDDRRPAAQRPVDGLRARHRRGAGADGGRVLHDGAPARLDRPRPARRRRHDGRRAARAVPGRVDDRRAEAADDAGDRGGRGRPRAARTPARSAGSPPTAAPTSAW